MKHPFDEIVVKDKRKQQRHGLSRRRLLGKAVILAGAAAATSPVYAGVFTTQAVGEGGGGGGGRPGRGGGGRSGGGGFGNWSQELKKQRAVAAAKAAALKKKFHAEIEVGKKAIARNDFKYAYQMLQSFYRDKRFRNNTYLPHLKMFSHSLGNQGLTYLHKADEAIASGNKIGGIASYIEISVMKGLAVAKKAVGKLSEYRRLDVYPKAAREVQAREQMRVINRLQTSLQNRRVDRLTRNKVNSRIESLRKSICIRYGDTPTGKSVRKSMGSEFSS